MEEQNKYENFKFVGLLPLAVFYKNCAIIGLKVRDMMKQIMIVEDDIALREELKLLLEHHGYTVIILKDFSNTLQTMLQTPVDLILLDINIPNTNGEYLLREYRKTSTTPVLMVTSRNNEMDELISMSYGADDYITKPYNPQILMLRIEAVLKRFQKETSILNYRHVRLNLSKGSLETDALEVPLSKNEQKIFHYLLMHVGTIVTREEIMRYLWDTEEFIDDNTLTVNMNRLRNRLSEVGLEDVIETRRGQGYILL